MWKDAWIGGEGTGKLISPIRVLEENATVDVFIDQETHTWRTDLIKEVLFPVDFERIMVIPISTNGERDKRVWAASDDGVFRVRDAYKIALKANSEASSSTGNDPIWRKMWKLNIPPKAKLFLWRALWDILPHGANLKKKGISDVEKCQRCGLLETNAHVLKDCRWARDVWANLMDTTAVPNYNSIRDWFGEVADHMNQQTVEFFGVCAWQIWTSRNEYCFEKVFTAPDLCYIRSHEILAEYKKANARDEKRENQRANARWTPPANGTIKVNIDVAVNCKENRVGLGVVARDDTGAVLMSASKTMWPFIEVERAEIEAFSWVVSLVKERGWNKVVFEGDAQSVVKALNCQIVRKCYNQVLIDNILGSLSESHVFSFNFCFREANNVAHRLARWASASVCSRVWLDDGPTWISDIVISDSSF